MTNDQGRAISYSIQNFKHKSYGSGLVKSFQNKLSLCNKLFKVQSYWSLVFTVFLSINYENKREATSDELKSIYE